MSRPLQRSRLVDAENGWCLRAHRVCACTGVLRYFAAVSRLGDGAFWYALMGTLVVVDGMAGLRASLHLAATGLVALVLYKLLKRWTRRPRPFASDVRIQAWVAPLDEFSFPSGHTLHAVAFSLVAMAHYPALAWLLVPFTASVAASRVVLGLHYPSDVLAATAIGSALAALALLSVAGLALCITFAWFSAPDLALTQLAVEVDRPRVRRGRRAEHGRLRDRGALPLTAHRSRPRSLSGDPCPGQAGVARGTTKRKGRHCRPFVHQILMSINPRPSSCAAASPGAAPRCRQTRPRSPMPA